ncbi:MAG: hypothetical protein U0871_23775 [Gemmataceae bacterium]
MISSHRETSALYAPARTSSAPAGVANRVSGESPVAAVSAHGGRACPRHHRPQPTAATAPRYSAPTAADGCRFCQRASNPVIAATVRHPVGCRRTTAINAPNANRANVCGRVLTDEYAVQLARTRDTHTAQTTAPVRRAADPARHRPPTHNSPSTTWSNGHPPSRRATANTTCPSQ